MLLREISEKIEYATPTVASVEFSRISTDSREEDREALLFLQKPYCKEEYVLKSYGSFAAVLINDERLWHRLKHKVWNLCYLHDAEEVVPRAIFKLNNFNPSFLKYFGVTGTAGKTSTALIVKHLIENVLNEKCGYVGTLGAGEKNFENTGFTTPSPTKLVSTLSKLWRCGCKWVSMEVSSHSLYLGRVSALRFKRAAFTGLSQEHLDFHGDFTNYYEAKKKLFTRYLDDDGAGIISLNTEWGLRLKEDLKKEVKVFTYGFRKGDLSIEEVEMDFYRMKVSYTVGGKEKLEFTTKCVGDFYALNILSGLTFLYSLSEELIHEANEAVESLAQIPGRFERYVDNRGKKVVIDYAHTPDGVEYVLEVAFKLSPKVLVVMGFGGDRDRKKRSMITEIIYRKGARMIITEDNPRTEPLDSIFADAVLPFGGELPEGWERIDDRERAILKALKEADNDTIVLLLGKGHERYQIRGKEKFWFSEPEVLKNAGFERI